MLNNLNGCRSIDAFVKSKLNTFNSLPHDFASLWRMMFSERENILYERSVGYRIEKTTYGQCADRSERLAGALSAVLDGTPYDSVVALHMENGIAWIELFWAILGAGFRPLLLNLRLDPATLERTLTETGTVAVISENASFSVRTIRPEELSGEAEKLSAAWHPERFGTELFVMSSGTSAHVKVCAYGAEEIYWQVNDSVSILSGCRQIKQHYRGELKLLTFLPFYHIFGLVAVYIWFTFFSRTLVHLEDYSPATITNTIRRHNVTHIFAVPLFWNKVYDETVAAVKSRGEKTYRKFNRGLAIARRINDVPLLGSLFRRIAFREVRGGMFGESIRFLIAGGSEIRPEVMELFNSIGYRLADGYGMTEIGITSVELSGKRKILNSCSVGKPFSSAEYRINGEGELLVRGKATAHAILEGGERRTYHDWYNTRDLAVCKKGRYYILGRRDDVVISPTGENLNPNLIEPHFYGVKGIREAALIGDRDGNTVTPVLILHVDPYINGERLSALREEVRGILARLNLSSAVGKICFTVTPLIDGSEIKLNRRTLAVRYHGQKLAERTPESIAAGDADEALTLRIREIFAKCLSKPLEEIGTGYDFFADGGGSSLDYFAALSMLGSTFSVSIPTDGEKSLSSVADIRQYLADRINR